MRRFQLLCLYLLAGLPFPVTAQQVGAAAPDFTLETFDGRKVTLSELKGKEVCIFTWASWCPYCKASLPGLKEYYQDAKKSGQPIEVLAVAIRDTPEKARKASADYAMPFPAGIESPGFDKLYTAARKTPTWVIVDKSGIVRQIGLGQSSRSEIEAMMSKAR
jgi:peroxiredoxin